MGLARGSNYSAANAHTDAMGTWSGSQSLLGMCTHWGAVSSLGMADHADIGPEGLKPALFDLLFVHFCVLPTSLRAQPLFDAQSILHMTAMLGVRMPFVRIDGPSGQLAGAGAPCGAPPNFVALPRCAKSCSSSTSSASVIPTLGSQSVASPHVGFSIVLDCLACPQRGFVLKFVPFIAD